MAEAAGADAVGVVLFSDSPRSVSTEQAQKIFSATGPFIARICVSHTADPEELNEILALRPTAVQISASLSVPQTVTRVIRVCGPEHPVAGNADALIIDASMGRGTCYDEEFAREMIRTASVPVILAGGLTPETVGHAVRTLHPYAVDVASGVETRPGIKDHEKIRQFIRNAREASE